MQLSSKKEELAVVFRDHHESVRRTGSYENNCLHRLVLSLLESVQSADEQASLEAAKCLGELGPSDLATIVLRPDNKLHTYKHVCLVRFINEKKILIKTLFSSPPSRVLAAICVALRLKR